MSEGRIRSSKVARKLPGASCGYDFLISPRMPDTVRILAPSNLATSSALLNMPRTKAVFRKTLAGVPVSFSFFTTLQVRAVSRGEGGIGYEVRGT